MVRALLFFMVLMTSLRVSAQWMLSYNDTAAYYYDTTGVITEVFEKAFPFDGKTALVCNNGCRLIDRQGKTVKTFVYHTMWPMVKKDEYSFYTDSSVGRINTSGKVLEQILYDQSWNWRENKEGYLLRQADKYGFFKMDEGLILQVEYGIGDFMSTFLWDGNLYFDSTTLFCLKRNAQWGLTNMYGKEIVPFAFDSLGEARYNLGYYAAKKGNHWGLIDTTGKTKIDFVYDDFLGIYSAVPMTLRAEDPYVFMKNGRIVFYSLTQGSEIPVVPAAESGQDSDPFRVFVYKNKVGIIDTSGKIMVPFEYDVISDVAETDPAQTTPLYMVTRGKQVGLLRVGKGLEFPLTEGYSIATAVLNGKAFYMVSKDHKTALYDSDQKPVTGFEYDTMEIWDNQIRVTRDNKWGTLIPDGTITWDN